MTLCIRFNVAVAVTAITFFMVTEVWSQNSNGTIQQPTGRPASVQAGMNAPYGQSPNQAGLPNSNPNAVNGQSAQAGLPPQAGVQPGAAAAPMGNAPFQLEPQLQNYLDEVLKFWQLSTSKIDRFESKFTRWQFDPTKTNNPDEFYTNSSGVVRYLKPDKGMFHVEQMLYRVPKDDGKFAYEALPGHFGEWWICDGECVHEYDRTEKKVTKHQLPANMRGAQVFNSPLPFVFGIDAEKIKQRYWMRPLPHPVGKDGVRNEEIIVLEAYPKFQSDAINYHHVSIFLDKKDFLPAAIEIALTQWTPQTPHREVFEFKERVANANVLTKMTEVIFNRAFIPEQPPKDWTVEERPFIPEEAPADGLRAANPSQSTPGPMQR
jgi:TIGR03009 family protein